MTFKEYLSLDEAISYLEKKQDLPVDFSDLQQLERTGRIKPLVYFTEIVFSDDFFIVEFSDKPIINGYFAPHDFILLDKHRVNPYREWGNEYFEMKYDFFKVNFITQCVPDTMPLGEIGQVYNYNAQADKGELVSEISYYQVFIKRSELDALFKSDNQEVDNHTIDELNQRIKQLEQQLEQSSQQSDTPTTGYTTDAIEALNAVVNEFWLDYDPEQKNATKQHTIKEWVRENYPMITNSMALWIDKIARHPSAK